MLVINYIRDNLEITKNKLNKRQFHNIEIIDQVLKLDNLKKKNQYQLDLILQKINKFSKEIASLIKKKNEEKINLIQNEVLNLKIESKKIKIKIKKYKKKIYDLLLIIPNLPHSLVPEGQKYKDNIVIFENKKNTLKLSKYLKHWELAKKYNLINFELGAKVAGEGFPVYLGKGAKLQRALISFFLDYNSKKGYKEVIPPFLSNEISAFSTGQLPDKENQMYYINHDKLYLIPTSEVPITNLYRNSIFSESELPILITGYSSCFRRESGNYGKNVRGLNRLHQFEKVEIVRIEKPENSYAALEKMVSLVKELIEKLELPYRILKLCIGELNFCSAITYDIEVWSVAQKMWLEVSSISNFESFQSNRLKLRYKDGIKTKLCHTLNGSALALPRIYAAILENNQTISGIKIPSILQPYTGFSFI